MLSACRQFGTLHPDHAGFTYWPGFSLNPGLWDVALLRAALGTETPFGAGEKRFEQHFSMAVADAGLRTANLPRVVMRHIGTDTSAYRLNDEPRPWDHLAAVRDIYR